MAQDFGGRGGAGRDDPVGSGSPYEVWEAGGPVRDAPLDEWDGPPPAPRLLLAGWWRRAAAAVIDGMLVGTLALFLLVPIGLGSAGADSDAGITALVAAFLLTAFVFAFVGLLYAPLMLWKTNGKTVGRMATGIRLVRASGEPMTLGIAVLREVVLKWLVFGAASIATGGIATLADYVWPLWDVQNRAIHDFPVDTRTILD